MVNTLELLILVYNAVPKSLETPLDQLKAAGNIGSLRCSFSLRVSTVTVYKDTKTLKAILSSDLMQQSIYPPAFGSNWPFLT